jgi:hypothetical protein
MFATTRYRAGSPGGIGLAVDVSDALPPPAFIVTEVLPPGWVYVAGSTRSRDRQILDEPRRDGPTCSWLFWGVAASDVTFDYETLAGAGDAPTVQFLGELRTSEGAWSTLGDSLWEGLSETDRVLRLVRGWNAFSVPLVLVNPDVDAVFGGDRGSRGVLAWAGGRFEEVTTLVPKQGYWMYCDAPLEVVLSGQPATDTTRTFAAGWNFFGPLADRPAPVASGLLSPVWSYAGGQYAEVVQLEEGHGYWVCCEAPVEVDLGP